ncbi:MAG: sigma-54-dependent Fis family transcriptional regulator [Nitrospirae bacterium]|nr:sigma-54-dependent Fis family transcriptional regulator [Nitrospirota bacterium]
MKRILIAEDKSSMRHMLRQVFEENGFDVVEASDGEEAVNRIREGSLDLVITDVKMPKADGMTVLKECRAALPRTPVIVMTAFGTIENAVETMRHGAFDYIVKPFSISEIELKAQRAFEQGRLVSENEYLKEALSHQVGHIVGHGEKMQHVYRLIRKVAIGTPPVFILGESGTGKELVAREIHRQSARATHPFIAVNCAALSEGLLESELFGHERGAFTGALFQKKGRFELADGGTLFLDEVAELSPPLQVKLLRALQEKAFERVGGTKTITTDVRILAATNRDVRREVAERRFREDLFFRLNVVSITLPPLRERPEDIPELVDYFLSKYSATMHKPVSLAPDVLTCLTAYSWPGNVRELENLIERLIVLADGDRVDCTDLPPEIAGGSPAPSASPEGLTGRIDQLEREMIRRTIEDCGHNQTRAAKILGLKRSSLQYKLKKYGLRPSSV